MKVRHSLGMILMVVSLSLFAVGQKESAPTIKHVPIKATSAASGAEMYVSYCAVCHGKDGKGAGPAAPAMKTAPTDLTTLSKLNGGKFPSAHFAATVRGEADVPAHGSKDMPVWGPLFLQMSHGHEAQVQQRISNLESYVESLQAK